MTCISSGHYAIMLFLNFGEKIFEGPDLVQKDPEVPKAYLGTDDDKEDVANAS